MAVRYPATYDTYLRPCSTHIHHPRTHTHYLPPPPHTHTGCSYHASNSSIVISPISATPILNIDHTLSCTVHAPFTYGLKPYWFIVKSNGSRERLPYRQRPLYNEGDCSWTNELTVRRFSSAMKGIYVCQYGEEMASVELELEGKEREEMVQEI